MKKSLAFVDQRSRGLWKLAMGLNQLMGGPGPGSSCRQLAYGRLGQLLLLQAVAAAAASRPSWQAWPK